MFKEFSNEEIVPEDVFWNEMLKWIEKYLCGKFNRRPNQAIQSVSCEDAASNVAKNTYKLMSRSALRDTIEIDEARREILIKNVVKLRGYVRVAARRQLVVDALEVVSEHQSGVLVAAADLGHHFFQGPLVLGPFQLGQVQATVLHL